MFLLFFIMTRFYCYPYYFCFHKYYIYLFLVLIIFDLVWSQGKLYAEQPGFIVIITLFIIVFIVHNAGTVVIRDKTKL